MDQCSPEQSDTNRLREMKGYLCVEFNVKLMIQWTMRKARFLWLTMCVVCTLKSS